MSFRLTGARVLFMASPQLENGYTKIANELLEALMTVKMSGSEWQFVMCLLRKTYGYNQKEAHVKNTYITLATGMCKERVSETKKKLLARKIVTEKRNIISLNKDYEEWIELRKNVTVVTEKRNNLLRKSVPIKERKKLNKTKESMSFNYNEDKHYEEVAIDAETGEPLTTQGKNKKTRAVDADVLAVFELFNNPAKALWRMREIERIAAQTLFDVYGLETLKKRVARIEIEKQKKDPYFPEVNTPSQLLDKMSSVERYLGI